MFSKKYLLATIVLLAVVAFITVAISSPNELNVLQAPHDASNAISCGSCHVPYNTIPSPVPANWLTNTVCLSCHRTGGVASAMQVHTPGTDTMWCQTCHNPHMHQPVLGRWFIKDQITTPNSGAHDVVVADTNDFVHRVGNPNGAYTGICQTCHTATGIFRNNSSVSMPTPSHFAANQSVSGRCINCHTHEKGFSGTCVQCHSANQNGDVTGWSSSAHGNPINPATLDKMQSQACASCHGAHANGEGANGIRTNSPVEQTVCLSCHSATPSGHWAVAAPVVIDREFQKQYHHPVELTDVTHRYNEVLPETSATAQRHIECIDCHNMHAVKRDSTVAGQLNPTLTGQWGIDMAGNRVASVTKEYQICLKCHSTSANLPAGENNKRAEFDTSHVAFHPVFGPGKNTIFASYENNPAISQKLLVPGWNSTSTMNCTDCHGNDSAAGPNGPHGSSYNWLLKFRFDKRDTSHANDNVTGYNHVAFNLCYQCHNAKYYDSTGTARNVGGTWSRSDSSRFSRHNSHTTRGTNRQESCFSCHDIHGAKDTTITVWGPVRQNPGVTPAVYAPGLLSVKMGARMVRWDSLTPGVQRPDSITTTPTIPYNKFGYYRFVNKYVPASAPSTNRWWYMRDTTLVGRDTVLAFCFVKCHDASGNHQGRTVTYRISH